MRYGFGYIGSKNQIAKDIIRILPKGERLVDLFGGGGAITHCAVLSGKWDRVLYNDINPLAVQLMQRTVNGEFSAQNFKPKWVSREEFSEKKDSDGYIKYLWSFGNDGRTYMYGKDIESLKKAVFEFVVDGKTSPLLDEACEGYDTAVTAQNWQTRKSQFARFAKNRSLEAEPLERMQVLERVPSGIERIGGGIYR